MEEQVLVCNIADKKKMEVKLLGNMLPSRNDISRNGPVPDI